MLINGKELKIAVVHDHLGWCGGGERTVLIMALELGADFITAYAHPDTFPEYQKQLGGRLKILSKRVIHTRVVRFFWLRGLFLMNKKLFKQYDVIIASTPTATEMVANFARNDAAKIVYTHTTPRRIFDKYEFSKKSYPIYLQPLFALFVMIWRSMYLRAIVKYNFNISNSNAVKKRVEDHTKTEINAVVWPPILTDKFKWISQGDYYLSWARIDELKRVELIVEAFQKMPDKKLIVASGGPRLEKVKLLAKNHPNIKIIGWVTDQQLADLVGNCRAAIYIPIDEDAGMTHLEANSAGKPVLAVSEGGLIESTVDDETGILLKSDPHKEDIIEAINKMTASWCLERKEKCILHAKKYSKEEFSKKIKEIVIDNDPARAVIGIDASRWENPRYPGKKIRSGVEIYSYNLIKNIIGIEKNARIRIYTPNAIPEIPLKIQKVLPGNKRWTQKILNRELRFSPVRYFFTPSYYIPKNAPAESFVTIHDIEFKIHPEKYSFLEGVRQRYATLANIARAKRIFTVSEYSKKQLLKHYKIPEEKIIVAPIGYDKSINNIKDEKREKNIVFIGRIDKKKSLDILIKAFADFSEHQPDWKLTLAGKPGYGYDELLALIETLNMKEKIFLPGYITEQEKQKLLTTASIFIQPSASEGSCIPLFEAWDAQLPALIADTPVFKEIGGEAAIYFKADDYHDLSSKISQLTKDKLLRDRLVASGNVKLNGMSWKKTAQTILSNIKS